MDDVETHILDLAKRRFERFGFPKVTMDEIAKDGRITKKTIYRHFRSKEELFTRVVIREALAARAEILQRLGEVQDPLARLEKLIVTALDYFREERFILKLLEDKDGIFLPFLRPEFVVMVEKETVNLVADILREGIKKGRIRELDEQIAGYVMFKIFQVFTYARTAALPQTDEDNQHEMAELLDFLMRAIGKDM
jgi:AcrR family transcriptional regulator